MKDEILIQKYTRALFEVAQENGVVKEVETGLKRIKSTFEQIPDLEEYLISPQIDWKAKLEIGENLAKGLSPYLLNFVKLTLEKERQFILPYVPIVFHQMLERQEKRSQAVVISAIPLDDEVRKQLKTKLRELFAEEFILESRTDPDVIGGVKIQIGYTVIDGTVKRKLQELGRLMAKG